MRIIRLQVFADLLQTFDLAVHALTLYCRLHAQRVAVGLQQKAVPDEV